ncbi:hypothetical protein [Nonomuraea cavernae]|uniref:hypothetical protein n=1 Tax=Nonomuraea cavernae TaxID=2045107 RepID=UPI00340D23C8
MDDVVDLLGRWASGRGPLCLLLTTRLRALIDDGILPPGEPPPPPRPARLPAHAARLPSAES